MHRSSAGECFEPWQLASSRSRSVHHRISQPISSHLVDTLPSSCRHTHLYCRRLVNLSSIPPSSTHHRAILARKQAPIYSPMQGDNQSEAKSHVRRVAVSQSLLLGARACPPLREAPAHPYTLAYGISQHLGSRHCWQSNSRQNLL